MNASERPAVFVTTEKESLDKKLIVEFLHSTYWAKDFSTERILQSIDNSFCFGLFEGKQQIGFARVVTDFTYTAWLADVFIVHEKQQKGYGQFLMEAIFNHERLKDIIKWRLATSDAHAFYEKFGFTTLKEPEKVMERIVG